MIILYIRKKYCTYILGIDPQFSLAPDHHNARADPDSMKHISSDIEFYDQGTILLIPNSLTSFNLQDQVINQERARHS